MTQPILWLVIASLTKTHIYKIEGKNYELLKTLEHPQSRLKSIELTSDRPGHYKTSHVARGKFIPPSDAHKEEHKIFAKKIADFLEQGQQKKYFQHIILCAEPYFYGLLCDKLTKSVQSLISKTIEKDYIPLPESKRNKIIEAIIEGNL